MCDRARGPVRNLPWFETWLSPSRDAQIKQERLRKWKELQSKYPAVDEEILYSTFKSLDVCPVASLFCACRERSVSQRRECLTVLELREGPPK